VLSDKEYIQQFGVFFFNIGQLADFFHDFMAETLCFVDDDENFFAICISLVEEMNKMNQEVTLAFEGFLYVECLGEEIVKIEFFETWIRDCGDQGLVVKTL